MGINNDGYSYIINRKDSNRVKKKRSNEESATQLLIIKYLKMKGFACGKLKTKGGFGNGKFLYDFYTFRGTPDLLCFTKSKMYFIEVKSETGHQTYDQTEFEKLCNDTNIPYILARSVKDVECVI